MLLKNGSSIRDDGIFSETFNDYYINIVKLTIGHMVNSVSFSGNLNNTQMVQEIIKLYESHP